MHKTFAIIVVAGAAALTHAQTAPRVQSPTASAAASAVAGPSSSPSKAVRRPLTPQEQREAAQFPDGAQPEQPVLPQVVVPLGRKPAPLAAAEGTGPAPKIDDQVARCTALTDRRNQAACVHAPAASGAAP